MAVWSVSGRSVSGRAAVWLATIVGAVLILAVSAVPAAAHNSLTATNPRAGQTVAQTPATVVLTFDQPAIAMGTQIVITGPAGPVQSGSPRLVDNTVSQDLQPGAPAGAYTVSWRITSTDGHPISGTFAFTATAAGAGTPPPDPPVNPHAAAPTASNDLSAAVWIAGGIALGGLLLGGALLLARIRQSRASN